MENLSNLMSDWRSNSISYGYYRSDDLLPIYMIETNKSKNITVYCVINLSALESLEGIQPSHHINIALKELHSHANINWVIRVQCFTSPLLLLSARMEATDSRYDCQFYEAIQMANKNDSEVSCWKCTLPLCSPILQSRHLLNTMKQWSCSLSWKTK